MATASSLWRCIFDGFVVSAELYMYEFEGTVGATLDPGHTKVCERDGGVACTAPPKGGRVIKGCGDGKQAVISPWLCLSDRLLWDAELVLTPTANTAVGGIIVNGTGGPCTKQRGDNIIYIQKS